MSKKRGGSGQQKFSGHGGMTKAGKVRFDQTPKVERTGVNSKPKKIPRVRYRELYGKRIIKKKHGGQPNSIGARRNKMGRNKK